MTFDFQSHFRVAEQRLNISNKEDTKTRPSSILNDGRVFEKYLFDYIRMYGAKEGEIKVQQ